MKERQRNQTTTNDELTIKAKNPSPPSSRPRFVSVQTQIVKLNFSSTSETGERDTSMRRKEKHKERKREKIEGDYVNGRHWGCDKAAQDASLHGEMSGCYRRRKKKHRRGMEKKKPGLRLCRVRKQINR